MAIVRNHGWLLAAAFVLAVSFVSGIAGILPTPSIEFRWPDRPITAKLYAPVHTPKQGHELMMVYIGSSTCSFANSPEMPALIEHVKLALQQKASKRGLLFSTMGVSIDWSTDHGLQHLSKFGAFDEIMTGRKWQSLGAHEFVWGAVPGMAVTPQVLVVARTIETPTLEYPSYRVFGENVAIHKLGVTQLSTWLERGTPLPVDLFEP